MSYCPNCGGEVSADAKFCTWCGKPLTPVVKTEAKDTSSAQPYTPTTYQQPVTSSDNQQSGYQQASQQQTYQQQAYQQPQNAQYSPYPVYQAPVSINPATDSAGKIALIFMYIGLAACVFYALFAGSIDPDYAGMGWIFLLPLAWCIPMTVYTHKRVKAGTPIGTGFKVCVLLFFGVIAGIALLVRKDS